MSRADVRGVASQRRSIPGLIFIGLALAAPLYGSDTSKTLPDGTVLRLRQAGAHTTLIATRAGASPRSIALPTGDGIYARSLESLRLVGTLGHAAILEDTYQSRPGARMAECGAGEETWLRIVNLGERPHQTWSRLVASCWQSIYLDDDVQWDAAQSQLSIALLGDAPIRLHVAPDGAATPVPATAAPKSQ